MKAWRFRLGLLRSKDQQAGTAPTEENGPSDDAYSSDSSVDDFATGGVCYEGKSVEPLRFGWEIVADGPQEVKDFVENIEDYVERFAPNSATRLSKSAKKRKSSSINNDLKRSF